MIHQQHDAVSEIRTEIQNTPYDAQVGSSSSVPSFFSIVVVLGGRGWFWVRAFQGFACSAEEVAPKVQVRQWRGTKVEGRSTVARLVTRLNAGGEHGLLRESSTEGSDRLPWETRRRS